MQYQFIITCITEHWLHNYVLSIMRTDFPYDRTEEIVMWECLLHNNLHY